MSDYGEFEATTIDDTKVRLDPRAISRFTWPMNSIVDYLRTHVAFVRCSNAYLFKVFDPDCNRYRHELRTHREMANILSKHRFPMPCDSRGRVVKDFKGSEFLDSGDILIYERIVFVPHVPGVCIPQYPGGGFRMFNIFSGFRFRPSREPLPSDLGAPFMAHAMNVLCNGDRVLFDYVTKWLGHLVQYPATKPGTALLLVSEPGAGKNIFFDIVRDVIGGSHYMLVNKADRVLSRFNSHLATKLLVVLDEASFDRTPEGAGVMKSLITQTDTVLEKKFADAVTVKSFERYVLLTNERFPVKVDRGDRRYCCIDVSNARVGDHGYFEWLWRVYQNPEALQVVYDMLASVPGIPPVLPPPPWTELKQSLVSESMSLETRFALALRTAPPEVPGVVPGDKATPAFLFSVFQAWLGANGYDPARASVVKLGSALTSVFGPKTKVRGCDVTKGGSTEKPWENVYVV